MIIQTREEAASRDLCFCICFWLSHHAVIYMLSLKLHIRIIVTSCKLLLRNVDQAYKHGALDIYTSSQAFLPSPNSYKLVRSLAS